MHIRQSTLPIKDVLRICMPLAVICLCTSSAADACAICGRARLVKVQLADPLLEAVETGRVQCRRHRGQPTDSSDRLPAEAAFVTKRSDPGRAPAVCAAGRCRAVLRLKTWLPSANIVILDWAEAGEGAEVPVEGVCFVVWRRRRHECGSVLLQDIAPLRTLEERVLLELINATGTCAQAQ